MHILQCTNRWGGIVKKGLMFEGPQVSLAHTGVRVTLILTRSFQIPHGQHPITPFSHHSFGIMVPAVEIIQPGGNRFIF